MPRHRVRVPNAGFSLLELALVLIISAAVVALAVKGGMILMQSAAITTDADRISDLLTEARQSAITQNLSVEVRIYDLPPQAGAVAVYDALQLHWVKTDGTTPPLGTVTLLSTWSALDATAAHSPLIASNGQRATPDPTDARLNAQTRVFHFLPDGTTDLDAGGNWFLTVRPASQSDPANFPSDWACVRVDATTGRVQIYRP